MTTYPLEEKYTLFITPALACAILIKDAYNTDVTEVPDKILEKLNAGKTPWDCATDKGLNPVIEEGDWNNVTLCVELLQEKGVMICNTPEFTGHAITSDGFGANHPAFLSYENDAICFLSPQKEPDLLKAAYATKQELLTEYEEQLESFTGPDVPWEQFIMDISGTYFC